MALRAALLGLLVARGPASGYALTKSFSESLSHVWSARHSQVYPELARMAAAGLIDVEEEGPRGRKRYAVTEAGREELRRWLTEEEPNRTVRNEVALRAFLIPTLPRRTAVDLVRTELDFYSKRRQELTQLRDALAGPDEQGFGYYAAELGVRVSSAMKEWADWAVEQLGTEDPPDDEDPGPAALARSTDGEGRDS